MQSVVVKELDNLRRAQELAEQQITDSNISTSIREEINGLLRKFEKRKRSLAKSYTASTSNSQQQHTECNKKHKKEQEHHEGQENQQQGQQGKPGEKLEKKRDKPQQKQQQKHEGSGRSEQQVLHSRLRTFVFRDFSLCHIKKNFIILEYQIKFIYKFF